MPYVTSSNQYWKKIRHHSAAFGGAKVKRSWGIVLGEGDSDEGGDRVSIYTPLSVCG
jgi:hypothetical protein